MTRRFVKQPFLKWELVWCESLQEWVRFVGMLPSGECIIGTFAMGIREDRVQVDSLSRKYVEPTLPEIDRRGEERFNAICDEIRQQLTVEKMR